MPNKVTLNNVVSLQQEQHHHNPTNIKSNCSRITLFFKRKLNILLLFIFLFKLTTFIILLILSFNIIIVICDILILIVFLMCFIIIVKFNQARITFIFLSIIYIIFYIGHFIIYFNVIYNTKDNVLDHKTKELYMTFLFLNLFIQNSILFTHDSYIISYWSKEEKGSEQQHNQQSFKSKGINIAVWMGLNLILLIVLNVTFECFINNTITFSYVMLFVYIGYLLKEYDDNNGDIIVREIKEGVNGKRSKVKRKSIIKAIDGIGHIESYSNKRLLYQLFETLPSFYGSCIVNSSFMIRYQNSFFANQMQHLCNIKSIKNAPSTNNHNNNNKGAGIRISKEEEHMSSIHINIKPQSHNISNGNILGNSTTALFGITLNNSLNKLNPMHDSSSSVLYLNGDNLFFRGDDTDDDNNNEQIHLTLVDKFNRLYDILPVLHFDSVSSFQSSAASPSVSNSGNSRDGRQSKTALKNIKSSHNNHNINSNDNSTFTNNTDEYAYKFLGRFKYYNYEKASKYYQIQCRKINNQQSPIILQSQVQSLSPQEYVQNNEILYEICFIEVSDNLKRNRNKMERKYKNLLLRKINHEFKGPIVFIQNLLNDVYEIDSVIYIKSICNMIRYVTEAILILVSDLTEYIHLNTMKVEEKELKSASGSLELSSLCNDIKNISFVYTKVFNRDVIIDLVIDEKLTNGRITINEAKLKQILACLITNAIKHASHMTIHFKSTIPQLTKSRTNTKFIKKKISKRQSLNPNVFKVYYKDDCSPINDTNLIDLDNNNNPSPATGHRESHGKSSIEYGLSIIIEDDGPGIDQYIINNINNSNGNLKEQQCDDVHLSSVITCGSYKNQKGLGTGLSICLKLCKDLDVSIHCERLNTNNEDDNININKSSANGNDGTRFILGLNYAIERDDTKVKRRNDDMKHYSGMTDQSVLTKTLYIDDYGIDSKEKEMVQYDQNNQSCYESPINKPRKQRNSLFTKGFPEYLIPCQVDSKHSSSYSSSNSDDDNDSHCNNNDIRIEKPIIFKCLLVESHQDTFSLISTQIQVLHNPYAYNNTTMHMNIDVNGGNAINEGNNNNNNEIENEITIPFPTCFNVDNNINNANHHPRSPKKKRTVTITKNTSLFNFMSQPPTTSGIGCGVGGGSSSKNAIASISHPHNLYHNSPNTTSNLLLPYVHSSSSFKQQDYPNAINTNNNNSSSRSSQRLTSNLHILKNLRDITIKDCLLNKNDTSSICSIPNANIASNYDCLNNGFNSNYTLNNNNGKDIIAIVDDIDTNRKAIYNLIKNYLTKKEKIDAYDIRILADGVEVIYLFYLEHLINKNQIKVIFSDECMDYLNGSEAFKIIQGICQTRKIKEVPYVICSAFNDNGHREKLISIGIKDVYEKPLKVSDIEMISAKYKL